MVIFTSALIAAGVAATTASVIVSLGFTVASIAYQNARMRKLKAEMDKRKQVNVAIDGEPFYLPVVYGKAKVSGGKVKHLLKSTYVSASSPADELVMSSNPTQVFASGLSANISGSKSEFLFVQQAICYGEIESVVDITVDDKNWNDASLTYGQRIHVFKRGSVADPMATANGIPSTNTFTNVAYASSCFRLNREDYNYNGSPNVSFFVKGNKLKDITYNSGTGVYSVSSTKAYSNNPALVLFDYLTNTVYGKGLSSTLLDLESFYEAKLLCDRPLPSTYAQDGRVNGKRPDVENEDGTITTQPTLPKVTLKLYECNVVLDTERSIRENIELLLESMEEAELIWSGGKYFLRLDAPETVEQQTALIAATITESDIIRGSMELDFPDSSSRYNQCVVRFMSEFENFVDDTVTWPVAYSTAYNTYLNEDSNILLKTELYLPCTSDPYHALAKAEQVVRTSRGEMRAKFVVGKKGLLLEPGDIVLVTDSTTNIFNEVMKIESVKLNGDLTAAIEARQYSYTNIAWNVPDTVPYISPKLAVYNKVVKPTSVVFTSSTPASGLFGSNSGKLTWTYPDTVSVSQFIVEMSANNGVTWQVLSSCFTNSFDILGLNSGVYQFAVRSVNQAGSQSERVLATNSTGTLNSFTIQRSTADQVAVVYANSADAATNTQSYTLGTNTYVAYYVYSSSLPTLPIRPPTTISFSKFVGEQGKSVFFATVFKQSVSAPLAPTTGEGTFNFGTNVLTPPTGWYSSVPSNNYYFMLGSASDRLRRFSANEKLEVSSLVQDTISISFSGINTTTYPTEAPLETVPTAFAFNNTGDTVYIVGTVADRIRAYTLSTPWDPSTLVLPNKGAFNISSIETNVGGIKFSEDGYRLYILGTTNDRLKQVNLSVPWDITTASLSSVQSIVFSEDATCTDFVINAEGTTLVVLGTSTTSLYQYSLSVPWDLTSVTYTGKSFSLASQDVITTPTPIAASPRAFSFDSSGKQLFVAGTTTDSIYQYSLSTAWDVSTTVYTGNSVVTAENTATFSMLVSNVKENTYSSNYLFSVTGDTGIAEAATWSTPVKIVSNVNPSTSNYNALVYIRAASVPATPTGGSYSFTSNTLYPPAGWSVSIPTGTNPVYVASSNLSILGATGSVSVITWSTPSKLVENGSSGQRGAGWWRYDAGSTDLTSPDVAVFWDALHDPNILPVEGDRFVIATTHVSGTKAFIYSSGSWVAQAEFIDGNLLVAGTITGNKVVAHTLEAEQLNIQSLDAITANLGKVTINESLNLEAAGSGFLAGRSSVSDYATNGFYIGREARNDGSVGFEVSHTSVNTVNNRIQGVIHDDEQGFTIYNPKIKYGGSASGGQTFYATTGTYNLGQASQLTISLTGGGGGGGGGRDDGYLTNVFAGTGGTTTVTFRDGSATGPIIQTYSAQGGIGGASASSTSRSGTSGSGTIFGPGGAGGAPNRAGLAGSGYGSGGGGAGGDDNSAFDTSGGSGLGGTASLVKNFTFPTNTTNAVFMEVTIGTGGTGGTASCNYLGGSGASGVVAVSSPLGGTSDVNYRAEMLIDSRVVNTAVGSLIWSNLSDYDFVNLYGYTNTVISNQGKWYLQGSTNGTTWVNLQELSIATNATGFTGKLSVANFNYRYPDMPQLDYLGNSTANAYTTLRLTANNIGNIAAGSKVTLTGGYYAS